MPSFVNDYFSLLFCHRLLELHSRVDDEKFLIGKKPIPALSEVRERSSK